MIQSRSKRSKGEFLTDEEVKKFFYLKKKYKIKNDLIARKVGISSRTVVSSWGKNIPARCRALLELWELQDKISNITLK